MIQTPLKYFIFNKSARRYRSLAYRRLDRYGKKYFTYHAQKTNIGGVADPHHFYADPDQTFTLMRIRIRLFTSMRIRILLFTKVMLIYDHWSSTLHTVLAKAPFLSLHASIVSVKDTKRLNFELLELMKFNADPEPAFHSNADPGPASLNNAEPDPQP